LKQIALFTLIGSLFRIVDNSYAKRTAFTNLILWFNRLDNGSLSAYLGTC
jgi:hypothetical protein